jgi:transcriptional regulator with XRE-family HTH domain
MKTLSTQTQKNWQSAFCLQLNQEFIRLKTLNSQFSLRAFAKRAQVSPGAMSTILSGKRNLSVELAQSIAARLGLGPISEEEAVSVEKNSSKILAIDLFQLMSSAFNVAMMVGLSASTAWPKTKARLAQYFGRTEREVAQSLEVLKKVQLADCSEEGDWYTLQNSVIVGEDIPSAAIKRFHQECLQEAEKKLFELDLHQRDFVSQTITADEAGLEEIKKATEEFRKNLLLISQKTNHSRVIRINIQTYYLNQENKEL